MIKVILKKSTRKGKKIMAIIYEDEKKIKTIHFGASAYEDYTIHKDDERKERYIKRHKTREDFSNILTAGSWSRYLLWNKKTISASIKDMEKRLNIKIINNII